MKTTWTRQRVERLFAHYNRKYWDSKLPHFEMKIADLSDALGQCNQRERYIELNVEAHKSDREIRGTLLHEMCHAATRDRRHGYGFWQQVESLLLQDAPIAVGSSEAPDHQICANAVPRQFPLARKAMGKLEAKRVRKLEQLLKDYKGETITITPKMIVLDFIEAAYQMTWTDALWNVGPKHLLIDVGGKPTSRRAARILCRAREAFQRQRREVLADRKFQAEVVGALDATGRNASERAYSGTEE